MFRAMLAQGVQPLPIHWHWLRRAMKGADRSGAAFDGFCAELGLEPPQVCPGCGCAACGYRLTARGAVCGVVGVASQDGKGRPDGLRAQGGAGGAREPMPRRGADLGVAASASGAVQVTNWHVAAQASPPPDRASLMWASGFAAVSCCVGRVVVSCRRSGKTGLQPPQGCLALAPVGSGPRPQHSCAASREPVPGKIRSEAKLRAAPIGIGWGGLTSGAWASGSVWANCRMATPPTGRTHGRRMGQKQTRSIMERI